MEHIWVWPKLGHTVPYQYCFRIFAILYKNSVCGCLQTRFKNSWWHCGWETIFHPWPTMIEKSIAAALAARKTYSTRTAAPRSTGQLIMPQSNARGSKSGWIPPTGHNKPAIPTAKKSLLNQRVSSSPTPGSWLFVYSQEAREMIYTRIWCWDYPSWIQKR